MKVIFSTLARQELEDAVGYCENEYPGFGKRFREEIRKAVKRIVEYPKVWSIEREEIRRSLLHRFPYKILYSIEENHIFIIALAHQHRKPDYRVEKEKFL